MTLILNKSNKDHENSRKQKKYFIILEQKQRMYLSESGEFTPFKQFALVITNTAVAKVGLDKINTLRKIEKQKVLCTVVHEYV